MRSFVASGPPVVSLIKGSALETKSSIAVNAAGGIEC